MYSFITGKIAELVEGQIVLENNGIGYQLFVSNNTLAEAGKTGDILKLYTYLYVKEDVFALYGFKTVEEKNMFLKLITISGVGPKLALQVLSGMDSKSLALSIVTGDIKSLSKVKGVGKKTAERIVLELREVLSSEEYAPDAELGFGAGGEVSDTVSADAVFALQSLGIARSEALKAVIKARKESDVLEEIITIALKSL